MLSAHSRRSIPLRRRVTRCRYALRRAFRRRTGRRGGRGRGAAARAGGLPRARGACRERLAAGAQRAPRSTPRRSSELLEQLDAFAAPSVSRLSWTPASATRRRSATRTQAAKRVIEGALAAAQAIDAGAIAAANRSDIGGAVRAARVAAVAGAALTTRPRNVAMARIHGPVPPRLQRAHEILPRRAGARPPLQRRRRHPARAVPPRATDRLPRLARRLSRARSRSSSSWIFARVACAAGGPAISTPRR